MTPDEYRMLFGEDPPDEQQTPNPPQATTAPHEPKPDSEQRRGRRNLDRSEIAALLAVVALVGTFLPWASVAIVSISGLEADRGQIAAVACFVAALLLFRRVGHRLIPVGLLAVAAAMGIWFAVDVGQMEQEPNDLFGDALNVRLGLGVYVTSLSAAAGFWYANSHDDYG